MKKVLLFVVVVLMSFNYLNAQFTVAVVNADFNGYEFENVITALDNSGYTYTLIDTPHYQISYEDIMDYDMVLWYQGNDGIDTLLWDLSDTASLGTHAIKFTAGLTEYVTNGGILWIDGLDMLYDVYGGAPETFAAGDFVYDVLGISEYMSQSYADDGSLGVSYLQHDAGDALMTVDQIAWSYSTLYYVDGLSITDEATALYTMGGDASYPLLDQVVALYRYNFIFSGLRLGKIDPQTDLDQVIADMFAAAEGGNFPIDPAFANINNVNNTNVTIYPNPATDYIIINSDLDNFDVEISDITGRIVISENIDNNSSINTSNLCAGIYNVSVISNKSVSSYKIIVK